MKENQNDIKVEPIKSPKSITIATPKGFCKAQGINHEKEKNIENDIEKVEDNKKIEIEDEKIKMQNGGQTIPPKPLPRASRTNSVSEDEPKPVARPRTSPSPGSVVTSVNPNAISGYKVVN